MQGSSRQSAAAARERLDVLLGPAGGPVGARARGRARAASPADEVGSALFGVVDLLDSSGPLRRGLTDPAQPGEAKAALVARLLDGKVPATVVELVAATARARWARSRDLGDALEELAVTALVAGAEIAGSVDRLEDELFRFERAVAGDTELAAALTDRSAAAVRKRVLVDDLVGGKVVDQTLALLHRAVLTPRGRSLDAVLGDYGRLAARRRQRLVARVRVAAPLLPAHRERLAASLARMYGHPVQLNVDVDPDVLGGIRVEIGDEVLDGTVARRLDDVRRRLAG
jgi:F-type H+-transporting ATPase subunit delta